MRMRNLWWLPTAGLLLGLCGPANAADPILDAEAGETPRHWSAFGDLLLRAEQTTGIPARGDDLERLRSRLRLGTRGAFGDFEVGAALEAALGSDANRDNRRNLDNERSDDLNLDQFYLGYRFGEDSRLRIGKAPLPLTLTPMLWDADLRPIGVSLAHSIAVGDWQRLSAVAGTFAGDHQYGDDSRLQAVQLGWHWREGSALALDARLAWLDFSDLGDLATAGLARTNRRNGNRFLHGFELLDAQLGVNARIRDWPLQLRIDWVRNTAATDQNQGARFSMGLGDSRRSGGWELSAAYQRIQRDAVLAAFNDDDWWFHSFARGTTAALGYGLDARWRLRFALFDERRDGIGKNTRRAMLELRSDW
ncbi:MAG: putative porin [Lysobacterales bacterium]